MATPADGNKKNLYPVKSLCKVSINWTTVLDRLIGNPIKAEFVVKEIAAAPDSGPYVLVTLVDPRDMKESYRPRGQPVVMGAGSIDELVKGITKSFGGQMAQGFTTIIKLDMREYEDSGLRIGDRVKIEISKITEGV